MGTDLHRPKGAQPRGARGKVLGPAPTPTTTASTTTTTTATATTTSTTTPSGTRCSPSSCGKRTARALPDPYHWEKMTMGTTRTDRTGAGATPTYAPPAPTPTTTASATTTSTSTTTASTTTASTTTTTDSTSRRDRPRPIRSTSECLPDVLPPRYTLDAPLHEPSWRLTALTAAGPLRRPAASAWLAGWLAPRGGLAGWLAGSLAAVLHLAAGSPSDRPLEQARAEDIDTGPPTRSASTASGWTPGLTSLGPGHLDLHLHDSPRLHGGLGTATILRLTAPDPDDPRPPTPLLILTPPDPGGLGTAPMLRRTAPDPDDPRPPTPLLIPTDRPCPAPTPRPRPWA